MKTRSLFLLVIFLLLLFSCGEKDKKPAGVTHPQWSAGNTIYELNIRQFSAGGTFKAIELRTIALKDVGAGIISLMPVFPIGEKDRRGARGSVYSVKDFRAVNPEFGTMEEFKSLVNKIHQMGMHVILQWVANQTSRDNILITEHPDWFTRDSLGNILAPDSEQSDSAELNYKNSALQDYMIAAMKFWLRETDIDGFHCTATRTAPIEFWNRVRKELHTIKPVFMLTEEENPLLHRAAFDASFADNFYILLNQIARGKRPAAAIDSLLQAEATAYPQGALRIRFTSNSEMNAWQGSAVERFGDGIKTFAVLSAVVPGVPMLYSGQEAGQNERLNPFDKQPIKWRANYFRRFYSLLFNLYRRNKALNYGTFKKIETDRDNAVYACIREYGDEKILAVLNLSAARQQVHFSSLAMAGKYRSLFTGRKKSLGFSESFTLKPWEYMIFVRTNK